MKSIQISLALLSMVNAFPAGIAQILPAGKVCGGPDGIKCESGICQAPLMENAWGICIGSTVSTGSDSQTESDSQPAKEGETCGGLEKIQCADGFYCDLENDKFTGSLGTCRPKSELGAHGPETPAPISNEGETCGGVSQIGCAENLRCKLNPQCKAMTPECLMPKGTCVPDDSIKEHQTDSNHTQTDDHENESANIQNEAESTPQTVNEGETCGGLEKIQCADGFYCDLENDKFTGSLGTCRPKSELGPHGPETAAPLANDPLSLLWYA